MCVMWNVGVSECGDMVEASGLMSGLISGAVARKVALQDKWRRGGGGGQEVRKKDQCGCLGEK